MKELTTERLTLEPLVEAHAPELFRVLVDPIIYTFLRERPPFTEEELRARYRFLEGRRSPDGLSEWLSWALRERDGGLCGTVRADCRSGGAAGLSAVLAPRVWGRGYAREALACVIADLAQRQGVSRFFATLSPRNEPGHRLVANLGFTPCEPDEAPPFVLDAGDLIYVRGSDAR